MKKNIYAFLLINCAVLGFMTTAAFSQGFSPQVQARLQHVLDSFQIDPANPVVGGMSAAIKVDELAFWQGATGYAARNIDAANNLLPGGTPFTVKTVSQIYSVTKTFTAALTLELVKEGHFKLSDPVSNFIPLGAINPTLNSGVTIQQLLAHESGYSDYTTEQQLQIAVAFDPTKIWTPFEAIYFVHQMAQPGAERRYSSTNYILLGAIIEAATGRTVEDLYRERFFGPLHLSSMYLGTREPKPAGAVLAAPHDNFSQFNPILQYTGQPTFPDAYTNVSQFSFNGIISLAFTGGGIVSNVADLAEWGNALFGGRATSSATLQQMLGSISATPDEDGDYLGYGIFTNKKISTTDFFVGHNGSAPGYRAVMFYQPDRRMTIAILSNYAGAKLYDVAKALYEAMPDFLCGNDNKKEDKIQVCWKGKNHCIARPAANGFMKKGAYLGSCDVQKKGGNGNGNGNKHTSEMQRAAELPEGTAATSLMAFPNPVRNQASLTFRVAQSGTATLRLYDVNGKLLKTLFNGTVQKGMLQNVTLRTNGLPAGVYISQLQTAQGIRQQKLVIAK
jgi:D-alanyl-D-alanine carboxypeptidase